MTCCLLHWLCLPIGIWIRRSLLCPWLSSTRLLLCAPTSSVHFYWKVQHHDGLLRWQEQLLILKSWVTERFSKKISPIELFLLCKHPSLVLYLKYHSIRKTGWCNVYCSRPVPRRIAAKGLLALRPAFTPPQQSSRWAAWMHTSLLPTPARAPGFERLLRGHVVWSCWCCCRCSFSPLFSSMCSRVAAAEFNTSGTIILYGLKSGGCAGFGNHCDVISSQTQVSCVIYDALPPTVAVWSSYCCLCRRAHSLCVWIW